MNIYNIDSYKGLKEPKIVNAKISKKEFLCRFSKIVAGTFLGTTIFPIASGCESDDYMAYNNYGAYSNYSEYRYTTHPYCNTACQDYRTYPGSDGYCNYLDYCDGACECF